MTNRTFEQVNSPLIVSVIKRARESLTELVISPEIALGNNAIGQLGLKLSQLTSLHLADLGWRTVGRDLVQWDNLQVRDLALGHQLVLYRIQ